MENKICLGINGNIAIDEALAHCKGFEEIYIGGYRGYKISFSENFNSSCLYSSDNIRLIQFDDLETDKDKEKAEKLSQNFENVTFIIN